MKFLFLIDVFPFEIPNIIIFEIFPTKIWACRRRQRFIIINRLDAVQATVMNFFSLFFWDCHMMYCYSSVPDCTLLYSSVPDCTVMHWTVLFCTSSVLFCTSSVHDDAWAEKIFTHVFFFFLLFLFFLSIFSSFSSFPPLSPSWLLFQPLMTIHRPLSLFFYGRISEWTQIPSKKANTSLIFVIFFFSVFLPYCICFLFFFFLFFVSFFIFIFSFLGFVVSLKGLWFLQKRRFLFLFFAFWFSFEIFCVRDKKKFFIPWKQNVLNFEFWIWQKRKNGSGRRFFNFARKFFGFWIDFAFKFFTNFRIFVCKTETIAER